MAVCPSRRQRSRRDHRLVQRERLDASQASQEGAGLVGQQPVGDRVIDHWLDPDQDNLVTTAIPPTRRVPHATPSHGRATLARALRAWTRTRGARRIAEDPVYGQSTWTLNVDPR